MLLFITGACLSHIAAAISAHVEVFSSSQTCEVLPSHDICTRQRHILEGDYSRHEGQLIRHKAWAQVGTCHHNKEDEFCAFSNPAFNGGDGISIITTRESMPKIASRSVFNDESDIQGHHKSSDAAPYEVADIPGKGFGLIATESIRYGQLIMSRTPAVVVNTKAINGLERGHLADLLRNGIESLSEEHRRHYLNLSTHDSAGTYEERIYKIFKTNSFRTGTHDGESDFHSTFTKGESNLCRQ